MMRVEGGGGACRHYSKQFRWVGTLGRECQ